MKTFVVAHIDWFNNDLTMEKVQAENWKRAVEKHTKYPFRPIPKDEYAGESVEMLIASYANKSDWSDEEKFKQSCFDTDCMMDWMEV